MSKEHYNLLIDQQVRLTPAAQDYLREMKIPPQKAKPEYMTHLNKSDLVPKTHPRIKLRGKLDSLQAKILEVQLEAELKETKHLMEDLDDLLAFVRKILASEVEEYKFDFGLLLEMDKDKLRHVSHNVQEEYGINHTIPSFKHGKYAILLNNIRTLSREVELCAIDAFVTANKQNCSAIEVDRKDLLEALNRLSSAAYIMYCRELIGYYGRKVSDE
jgi:ethanolamine utilization cobalamin adenosyltransferase